MWPRASWCLLTLRKQTSILDMWHLAKSKFVFSPYSSQTFQDCRRPDCGQAQDHQEGPHDPLLASLPPVCLSLPGLPSALSKSHLSLKPIIGTCLLNPRFKSFNPSFNFESVVTLFKLLFCNFLTLLIQNFLSQIHMPPVPYHVKIGAKRPPQACLDNMSTPNKRIKINKESRRATPPIGQVTFNVKVPPHGYQVQSASSE